MFGEVLPLELAFHILSFLEPHEHFIVNQVSREWRDTANDKSYWKNRCKKRFKISDHLLVEEPTYRKAYFRRRAIERLWEEGVANVMHIRPPISGFSPLVRQNPTAQYPQKVTKVQFDSQKVVFMSMSALFVCDSKTGDFLWNDQRVPMPKMEENLPSSEDALPINNNFEAISTQESLNNSQPSSQKSGSINNNNLGSPVSRKLNFTESDKNIEEDVEESNSNITINTTDDKDIEKQEGQDQIEQTNFGVGSDAIENNHIEEEEESESYEETTNVLNMSEDNIGEPSLRSPLFKSKNLKRKRGLDASFDDIESPLKKAKYNADRNNDVFPNMESTPTKRHSSPKKSKFVQSPSLALLEEEDELDDELLDENQLLLEDSENNNNGSSGLGIFKTEPDAHFADAYETFHFDDNILAVSLSDAPYCDVFIVTKKKLELQQRVFIEEISNQIQISKRQNILITASNKSSIVRIFNLTTGDLIRSIVHPSAQALSMLAFQKKEEEESPSAAKRKFKKFINIVQNQGANSVPSFTNVKVPQEFNPHEGCDPAGIRSIQLRGDKLAIANASQICLYNVSDGFVVQTYKTLCSLYPKVQMQNFEIGKIQFDDDIVIACYPLNDIVCLWTAKGGELIKIKRHFTQDMKLAESRIVTLDSVRRSFSLWSWNFFYMYQVQHKIDNSCCVDFNAFMVACGTVEGEVQLFDFEQKVIIPSQHAHKELSQYSIHTIQSITIQEKYRNVSFEELHYRHWLQQQHNNNNSNGNNNDHALEYNEKSALEYDNTNEPNNFDFSRMPILVNTDVTLNNNNTNTGDNTDEALNDTNVFDYQDETKN